MLPKLFGIHQTRVQFTKDMQLYHKYEYECTLITSNRDWNQAKPNLVRDVQSNGYTVIQNQESQFVTDPLRIGSYRLASSENAFDNPSNHYRYGIAITNEKSSKSIASGQIVSFSSD